MIIPEHIHIEAVNGTCTSRCIMCRIEHWTRKPNIMDNESFRQIIEKFKPYRDKIQYVTLHGCGEPLIDKELAAKIKIAKEMGFKGVGFATNCTLLNKDRSRELVGAGLDTIICSIDGIKKDTHESIRIGTKFDVVVSNVKNFMKIRNEIGMTKTIIRFIRQEKNKDEWIAFLEYWSKLINKDFGDEIIKFDIHNCGGKLDEYQFKDLNREFVLEDGYVCEEVFERMSIFSDGNIAFCNADDNQFFYIGNALKEDPIQIYNGEIFERYRDMMKKGRIRELKYCNTCTIPRSREIKNREIKNKQ